VSDGEETCGGNPCEYVKTLKDRGVNFTMHVVGFDVNDAQKTQLSCIAKAGEGRYFAAQNALQLEKAFTEVKTEVTKTVEVKTAPQKTVEAKTPPKTDEVLTESSATLNLDKASFAPGEQINLHFTVSGYFEENAWVGIIPSKVPHGSEAENDRHDLTYQYLKNKTSGTLIFKAPTQKGSYDFRMNDTDNNGREVGSVSFIISN